MVLVEEKLFDEQSRFRQLEASSPEAGGILMGYRRGNHTHVTEATLPTKAGTARE